jgi:steroid delta-isomerase
MEDHPARAMSLRSKEYTQTQNKEAWLGMFAENGKIEDPIGISYLDENGQGHCTPEAREAFWDNNIANSDISITIHHSYACGSEVANNITIDMEFEMEGKRCSQQINGIFTYCLDDEGKLLSMRGYWQLDEAMKTIEALG